jgi:glycosyltransferase involved in cell wall biosynthesis
MVSDGTLREELKAMAIKLDIKDNVIFKGKLQLSQFVEILNQTHLYVTLAFSDGNSVSLTEAMACGAFSIASDIPANRQWISDGVNGFLVPVDDPDSLAQKILYVYENYNKLEVNCHHYNDNIINEKGLWFKNMEKVQQKYESLVKN